MSQFEATQEREAAQEEVVRAAAALEKAPPGPERIGLFEVLMAAVRRYNLAEARIALLVQRPKP